MTTSSHLFDANWYLTSPRTPSFLSRISPNLGFYAPMIWIVFKAGCNAMRNQYDGEAWAQSSEGIAHALESVGCRIEAAGMEHFRSLEGPCVFIGNHMSTLETFVLPSMIQPWKDVTFVVKESLLKYPFFGPVLGSREPIVVGRSNPREDLVAVLEGGEARLKQGRSVIVFPQSTRSSVFDLAFQYHRRQACQARRGSGHSGGAQDRCVGEREPPQRFRPGGCQKDHPL